jgi:hypothetical protein
MVPGGHMVCICARGSMMIEMEVAGASSMIVEECQACHGSSHAAIVLASVVSKH